jgi:hypothetical protein
MIVAVPTIDLIAGAAFAVLMIMIALAPTISPIA